MNVLRPSSFHPALLGDNVMQFFRDIHADPRMGRTSAHLLFAFWRGYLDLYAANPGLLLNHEIPTQTLLFRSASRRLVGGQVVIRTARLAELAIIYPDGCQSG